MKKSLVGIIAAIVFLALIITGVVIGVSGDDGSEVIFNEEFTETVNVENGVALTKETEKVFTVENAGKYVLSAEWKPEESGLLTGCTITNEVGEIIFASTADWCTMRSAPLKMEEGTYTLTMHYLTSKEQWYGFWYNYLINSNRDNSDFTANDVEYTFAVDEELTIPFKVVIEKQSMEYMLGFLTGIGVVFIISFIFIIIVIKFIKKDGSIKCKYDERQELIRGRGFKYAFFTFLIYNFVIPMFELCEIEIPADNYVLFIVGGIIGILVYVIYAIWNEAYISLNENPKKVVIALTFIGLANLGIGVMSIVEGRFLTDGRLTFHSTNFLLGVTMMIIVVTLVVKQIVNKREED